MFIYKWLKKFITHLLLLLLILFSAQLFSQSVGARAGNSKATEADIIAIRKAYQKINSSKLIKKHFTYESNGCVNYGVVDYYFSNNKIVKITESGAIGDGSWTNEYYFSAGKVIFCLETNVDQPGSGKVTIEKYRYYIKNDRPVRLMDGNKISPLYNMSTDVFQAAYKIYKAYKTKNFAQVICDQ